MFSSYCNLNPVLHRIHIDIRDAWSRPGTMWARFEISGIPAMSRLHVCVDLSFDMYGRLMEICLLSGCKLFTGVTGRTQFTVSPAIDIYPFLVICIFDIEYALSICLLF